MMILSKIKRRIKPPLLRSKNDDLWQLVYYKLQKVNKYFTINGKRLLTITVHGFIICI